MQQNFTPFWMLKAEPISLQQSQPFFELQVGPETLQLHAGKFAWWPKERTLFLADCHFGKIAHFRKSGIGLPSRAGMETFSNIHRILLRFNPEKLVLLGDVFHSDYNQDTERFRNWRSLFPEMEVILVLGNHDKASFTHLHTLGIQIKENLLLGPFLCSHEPDFEQDLGFNLCGHLHPGVTISVGHQHVKMPCFWKGINHLCFPSFGAFTGSVSIKPTSKDLFFAITGKNIRILEGSIL
jgi:DNA ligase-associated metallophosphoesterase